MYTYAYMIYKNWLTQTSSIWRLCMYVHFLQISKAILGYGLIYKH